MEAMPKTMMEAVKYFAQPGVAHAFLESLRFPDGVKCPHCDSDNVAFIATRERYQCRACRKQSSIKTGTIFEDSPIKLDKWLCAIWLITSAKNGISSYEIGRAIGVTQKTAWFMDHRIRLALQAKSFDKMGGIVEADETFIGAKARNMHAGKRKERLKGGRGTAGKMAVFGLLERHGNVRTEVIHSRKKHTLDPKVREHVEAGSEVHTDALGSYNGLSNEYVHKVVDHAEKYVDGNVHTNGMENYWSLLKRTIRGTYVSVEPYHLFRYLDEQAFRFNSRKMNDFERFTKAVRNVTGKRLTYAKLIVAEQHP